MSEEELLEQFEEMPEHKQFQVLAKASQEIGEEA